MLNAARADRGLILQSRQGLPKYTLIQLARWKYPQEEGFLTYRRGIWRGRQQFQKQ
jgi:hypothetical protein